MFFVILSWALVPYFSCETSDTPKPRLIQRRLSNGRVLGVLNYDILQPPHGAPTLVVEYVTQIPRPRNSSEHYALQVEVERIWSDVRKDASVRSVKEVQFYPSDLHQTWSTALSYRLSAKGEWERSFGFLDHP